MSGPSVPGALVAASGAVALVMTGTAALTRSSGKAAYVDAAWGASFVAAAWAALGYVIASGYSVTWRAWLLTALVTMWGSRLTWHLARRVKATLHDDPRYEDFLGGPIREVSFGRVILKVFGLQAVLVVVVAIPVVVGVARPVAAAWPIVLGTMVWMVGLWFETVSDAQLANYRAEPGRPPLLTTGLWAWSRHPNYFGDFCVWWGLWMVGGAASGGADALGSVASPILMTWILVGVSGVRLAEKRMQGRPGWTAYRARTPIFFPLPPVRKAPSNRGVGTE